MAVSRKRINRQFLTLFWRYKFHITSTAGTVYTMVQGNEIPAIIKVPQTMIISASRRTDIPAFYAEWFMNRVRDGFFYRMNPFNSKQVAAFSLKAEDVDAICFWSKNPGPIMKYLDELDERGLHYYFQFTLNPYDREFEPNVPARSERIALFQELAGRIGAERVVWRYDPVILSSITPVSWHLDQAEEIAGLLGESSRRMVFSFYDFYGRGHGRLYNSLQKAGISLMDIAAPEYSGERDKLLRRFKLIASSHKLSILSCAEDIDLSSIGIEHGSCVDGALIHELFAVKPSLRKDMNQRKSCGCVESVDMGFYNSCPYRCSYCYANFNEGVIESNCQKHDPDSPALLGQYDRNLLIRKTLHETRKSVPMPITLAG